jgi:acyl-coenzyme A synthetase/AMP-(fatty) acid ligase
MKRMRKFNSDFEALVQLQGDKPALVRVENPEAPVSYAQLMHLLDRHLAWFKDEGLVPGDCIGAVMPNSVETIALFLAAVRAGLKFAPLACETSSRELVAWAEITRPKLCILGEPIPSTVAPTVSSAGLRATQVRSDNNFAHLPETAAPHLKADGAKLYLFTSGTTGAPKVIVMDADRLWSAGIAFAEANGIGIGTPFRIWNYLPHSYLGGLFNLGLIPLSVGGSTVIDETFSGKTFLSFWQTVDRCEINSLWLVPSIVRGLVTMGDRAGRGDLKSIRSAIRVAFLGTAPIELEIKRRFEEIFGIPLRENFALSETTFISNEHDADAPFRSTGSAGRILDYVKVRIDNAKMPDDPRYGEILVDTPFLADGYLGSDGNISIQKIDGFFPTGDLGYLDSRGQLVVTGRSKDIIKKGGYLVALREIEILALTHPLVEEAAAVPVPHRFYGESYRLYVRFKPAADPARLGDVSAFIFSNLAKYKWPDGVELVEEFPRTASGKIRKFLLQ